MQYHIIPYNLKMMQFIHYLYSICYYIYLCHSELSQGFWHRFLSLGNNWVALAPIGSKTQHPESICTTLFLSAGSVSSGGEATAREARQPMANLRRAFGGPYTNQCTEATATRPICPSMPTTWDNPTGVETIIAPGVTLEFVHCSVVFGFDHLRMFRRVGTPNLKY